LGIKCLIEAKLNKTRLGAKLKDLHITLITKHSRESLCSTKTASDALMS